MSATDQVQQQNELDNAELSLQEASVRLQTLSYQDDDDVASFDLAGRNSDDVRIKPNGNLTFRLNGHRSCTATMEVNSLVYRNDKGQSVAYQAGGVWRDSGDGVSIVSPPDLTYQTDQVDSRAIRSLDFPVVNVQGDLNTASGEVTARQVDKSGGPNMEEQLCLPVSGNSTIDRVRTISITVENNTYYEAWERYLDDEFGNSVMDKDVFHDNQTVRYRVPLGQEITPSEFTVDDAEIPAAVWGTSGATMEFQELPTPGHDTKVDSYDSGVAPYTVASGSNATVVNNGPLTLHRGSKILGDVAADGDVTVERGSVSNPTRVEGSISYNGTNSTPTNPNGWEVTGAFSDGFSFNANQVPPPDADISYTIDSASQLNNNNDTPVFNASFSDGVRQAGTVDSGVYFVENLQVDSGEPLTFDTSNGDIVVAVNRSVDIDERVEVHGDGQVRLFVKDDVTIDDEVKVFGTSASPTNESRRLWTFAQSGSDITLETSARYTGVIYAPGAGETRLESLFSGPNSLRSEVFGALIGGETVVEEGSQVHFDMDIQTSNLDSDGDGVPDSSDSNNSVPDSDQDAVPNSYDDCPNGDQNDEGVNGCLSVTEDESANALVVNQSQAQLTIAGSMVADNRTRTREVGEREPIDVVFVLDDSGSMGNPEVNKLNSGDIPLEGTYGSWSEWKTPESASYVHPEDHKWGFDYVPEDQQWEVRYKQPKYMTPAQEVLHEGQEADYRKDNNGDRDAVGEVRRRVENQPQTETVPPGEVWLASTDSDPDEWEIDDPSYDTQWFFPGDTISSVDWNYYERYGLGNDPNDERADAMRTFIGMLNASRGDNVGAVEFTTDVGGTDVVWDVDEPSGSNFDGANSSLSLDSEGGTPMEDAIEEGEDELLDGENDQKVMVLLTDGRPDGDNEDVVDAAEDVDDSIQIQTVGLGGNTNQNLLDEIADATGGNFSQVGDSEGLNDTFRQIAGDVTQEHYNVIEYKNTTVNVSVGGMNYPISLNANTPTDSSHPTTTIDIASLQGASDDELEEYVGTLLSAEVTTQSCQNVSTFNNVTGPDGDEYAEVTCDGTAGTVDDIDNGSKTGGSYDQQIYVDGEDVPSNSDFDGGWFKDQTFSEVIDQYENDISETLVDDSTDTFDIGQNDAVIVVRTNSSNGDTDYVVMHFEALDTAVDYDVNTSNTTNNAGDPDDNTYSSDEDNSYVISIDENTVELGNESANIVALPGDATNAMTTGDAGGTPAGAGVPSMALAADARARPAA